MKTHSVAYPIIFTITELVPGRGFLAQVNACGKALMLLEDDGAWWLTGAEPGAIAEGSATPQEAFVRFGQTFKNVLADFAAEAQDLNEFREAVRAFVHQADKTAIEEWVEALAAIRDGRVKVQPPFTAMNRKPAETKTAVSVEAVPVDSLGFASVDHNAIALPAAA